MADVVKMGIATSKESVSKGPVKDDCHLPERPDESAATRDESASVSNQNLHDNFSYFSNSLFEFDARRNQLRGSALVSNQNLWDNSVTHPLSTSYDAKREEEFLKFTPDFILKVHIDDVACPLSNSFIEAATREDQLQESSSLSNQNLHDSSAKDPSASVDTNLQQLSIENDMPKTSVKELQHVQCGSFGSGMNGSAQPSSLPSGFLNYDDSEDISGSVVSPLSLQMQNINTIPTMRQQAYTKEPDPQASPLNQSMPTTSSLVLRLSVSMTETLLNASISEPQMNQQAMDHHQSQPMVPSGNDGDMMNYPYSQPTQNDTYNMSAFQKNGGHNNNSDTAANSMCGYEDVLSSEFSNQMATLHHQNGTSNMWTPQGLNDSGNDYYSLFSGPQKQQSESFRHSQQQQGQEQEQPCEDESSRYYASPDQGNK
ncbi:PREDICTED: uncharacterized protein LOC104771900 [Camelina sativa]|uniref:Uncharacterized protein LOC104771900 n=1 Tax=Camelina sativa TaxID=90675 RepID=A0ABM0Y3C0_CAMSA|nr:PREDICTED: uncharacterized protein LOC104771900 [Camelina sativa]